MISESKEQFFEALEDIISVHKKQYALKGDRLRFVSDFVNVYILQNERTGVKFPTKKHKVKAL